MTALGPYTVHPAADAYPLIDGEEFDRLVDSVKRNGLREPIVLNHDKSVLIDGRNRWRACEQAGVDPVFETLGTHYTDMKVLEFIVDRNERRRDLNPGQKAMVALALEPMFAEAAKEEQRRNGLAAAARNNGNAPAPQNGADLHQPVSPRPAYERKAATKAAQAVGASGRAVAQAKAVQRDAPDLADKVRAGALALDAADRQRKQRMRRDFGLVGVKLDAALAVADGAGEQGELRRLGAGVRAGTGAVRHHDRDAPVVVVAGGVTDLNLNVLGPAHRVVGVPMLRAPRLMRDVADNVLHRRGGEGRGGHFAPSPRIAAIQASPFAANVSIRCSRSPSRPPNTAVCATSNANFADSRCAACSRMCLLNCDRSPRGPDSASAFANAAPAAARC